MAPTDPVPRVVVVGSTNIDLVAYTPRIPAAGETLIGDRFSMGFGGKGANQAVMARLLGAEAVMVGCVGDDVYGEMARANFEGLGVDVTHLRTVPGASGVAPIWVEPDGTNRIIVVPGANRRVAADQAVEALSSMPGIGAVVGQFEIPQDVTAAAFAEARRIGVPTILNPAPGDTVHAALLEVTDWLIPNEGELAAIVDGGGADDESLVRAGRSLGCRLVVTLGAEGAALVTADGSVRRFPAPRVGAVDTTGAGDAFIGSFAYAIAAGWPEDRAVRLGLLCAADSVTREGSQASFPRGDRAASLLEEARAAG